MSDLVRDLGSNRFLAPSGALAAENFANVSDGEDLVAAGGPPNMVGALEPMAGRLSRERRRCSRNTPSTRSALRTPTHRWTTRDKPYGSISSGDRAKL